MPLDKDKPKAAVSSVDKYKAFLKRHLCSFQTAGRRCQILGGHEDHGPGSQLCSWHWLNQSTPQFLQDREEFIKYRCKDRQTYSRDWLQASLYVEDDLVWACTLGKEQHAEFARALRVVENECDKEVFGENSRGTISDIPPPPETSVQEYAEALPF